MDRNIMLQRLNAPEQVWDIIVIGGGATGLGIAVDAASRGYSTLLVEQSDFAKATSSKSTKLIHGGLRYLKQGNVSLVIEALKERGLLCQNAPHLVHHQSFLVPNYHWWEGPFYGIGLKIYDLLAGSLGMQPSRRLTLAQTLRALPTIEKKGLRGGALYYDGQFDDARLAISLAQTAVDSGGVLLNYMKATHLIKKSGLIAGIRACDEENGKRYQIKGRCVINATGVFADHFLKEDKPQAKSIIAASQGVHIVLDRSFLPGETAILVPKTDDNRILFIVPWLDRLLVGTTDTPVSKVCLEPKPLKSEISFLLQTASRYLIKQPQKEDILSVFAGLRPLVRSQNAKSTATLARDHALIVSQSGLITIAGGKWTTYRKMAQDAVDKAMLVGNLPERACLSKTLPIHGWQKKSDRADILSVYGSDSDEIKKKMQAHPSLKKPLHERLPYVLAQVVWAVEKEMARSVEDVLARRTRSLLLDARASMEAAPKVARLMAKSLQKSRAWEKEQVAEYTALAKRYLP